MVTNQMHGGWSEPAPLTTQDKKVFAEATRGLTGVVYTPYLVSTQVVNGTNYRFFCGAKTVTRYANVGFAIVSAHKTFDGRVHLINIQTFDMDSQSTFGGEMKPPSNYGSW